ncbi:hypothetical protein SELMODRAFT_123522 [Selaginella moellendorffii]|uniref:Rho GDP-dissociation inhibitor 1 n=1 Tax=Selaginella moellendorffii TaxID=88036 RepID=D8SSD4_SELML|nr:hypothetical protein SELMODRAFT_123522 [Selaginella moellendorffii]
MNGFIGSDGVAAAAGAAADATAATAGCSGGGAEGLQRQLSRVSLCESDEEDSKLAEGYLGPLVPLRDHIERDKDDESLRRWKEQLLGSLPVESFDERLEPEVRLSSLTVIVEGRPDVIVPLPLVPNSRGSSFSLKEGTSYCLKFTFSVHHNLVSGLVYSNTVWKNGLRVDQTRKMLGTFAPHQDPYTHTIDEETTPSGILARGNYSAKMKASSNFRFLDDDKRCYLDLSYSFEIRKEWD